MANMRTSIVILGAGYAGIRAAVDLCRARKRGEAIDITLVTDRPYHIDTPALYEVATAYLHRESAQSSETIEEGVGVSLNDIFVGQPIRLMIRTVRDIAPRERLIHYADGTTTSYDILVIALGAALASYGIPGVSPFAFSVKTISEALELRHRIVRQFMMAKKLPPAERANSLSFAVIGAGATGVETAAELCGQVKKLCARHQIDTTCPRVFLIEAKDEILPSIPARDRHYAMSRLRQIGIDILCGQSIASVEEHGVVFTDGRHLPAATVIWTGGLKVHPALSGAELPLAVWGVACETTLQVKGQPNIFAAGDAAVLIDYPTKIPGVVPVAYTQGALVAANIVRLLHHQTLKPYRYHTWGAIITLGGKAAVALLSPQTSVRGLPAWLLKRMVTLRYWLSLLSPHRALSFWRHGIKLHSMND